MNEHTIIKLIISCGVLALSLNSIVLLCTPPSSGYELSIYDPYPNYFWISTTLLFICGIILIFWRHNQEEGSSIHSLFGFYLILITNCSILLLPLIRGYAFYGRSDALSHAGYVKDIIISGHIGDHNFYPIFHVIIANLAQLTDFDISPLIIFAPTLFYLLYIIFIFLLGKSVSLDKYQLLLIIIFSMPLMNLLYSTQFFLGPITLIFIPIILYINKIRYNANSGSYAFIFLLLLILVVFSHPATALYLVAIFMISLLSSYIYKYLIAGNSYVINDSFRPPLFIFLCLFTWFSLFGIFNGLIKEITGWFLFSLKEQYFDAYQTAITKADISLLDFIYLLIKTNGHQIIYAILSFLALIILMTYIRDRRQLVSKEAIFFSLLFSFGVSLFVLILVGGMAIATHPLRESIIAFQSSAILNGLVLSNLFFDKEKQLQNGHIPHFWKSLLRSLLILSVVMVFVITTFNVHASPSIKGANPQVTNYELFGSKWIFEKGLYTATELLFPKVIIVMSDQLGWRMADFNLGSELGRKIKFRSIPHFGYSKNISRINISDNELIVLTKYDITYYTKLWPRQGAFNYNDFSKLNSDPSLAKIYENKEFSIYSHAGDI